MQPAERVFGLYTPVLRDNFGKIYRFEPFIPKIRGGTTGNTLYLKEQYR